MVSIFFDHISVLFYVPYDIWWLWGEGEGEGDGDGDGDPDDDDPDDDDPDDDDDDPDAAWWMMMMNDDVAVAMRDCGISTTSQTRPICKHRFCVLPVDKTLSVVAQNGLLWRSFCSSSYQAWD